MPAWGTVTTSPACSTMLFFVFPVSMSWFKLTVIVSTGVASDGALRPLRDFSWEASGAGKYGGSMAAPLAGELVEGEVEGAAWVSGFASDLAAVEPDGLARTESFVEGSGSSNVICGTGRVTMTSSPASLETPPASARTSRSV